MQLLPFLAVAAIVIVTPGVDMALVTKNALFHGRRCALATALGVNVGIAFWATSAALGLAALISASAAAFAVIKIAGALYLVYLGLQALRASRGVIRPSVGTSGRARPRDAVALRQGVLSTLLNGIVLIELGARLALDHHR